MLKALARHATPDRGTLKEPAWQPTYEALLHGGRIFSVYQASDGTRFYVTTESDRTTTTVFLPEDY